MRMHHEINSSKKTQIHFNKKRQYSIINSQNLNKIDTFKARFMYVHGSSMHSFILLGKISCKSEFEWEIWELEIKKKK